MSRVILTIWPETAVEYPPSIVVEQLAPLAAATLKPAPKVTLITPSAGIGLADVKLTVAVPVALSPRDAGSTFVELNAPTVIVSAATIESSSNAASPVVVVAIS